MAKFFDKFPITSYDISNKQRSNYQFITNILFRVHVVREVINNVSAYYEYLVKDDDTPEILAEKVYGDPEAHWIILLANDIVDPQYDWPLNYDDFNNYIIGKYGSLETALTEYHHYEKVVRREEKLSGVIVEQRFIINQANLTSNLSNTFIDVPYDTYNSLADEQDVNTINYNLSNGKTIFEITYRDRITNYDYEVQLNDEKRSIKIIKPEYYSQIIREFDNLTQNSRTPFMRRLV